MSQQAPDFLTCSQAPPHLLTQPPSLSSLHLQPQLTDTGCRPQKRSPSSLWNSSGCSWGIWEHASGLWQEGISYLSRFKEKELRPQEEESNLQGHQASTIPQFKEPSPPSQPQCHTQAPVGAGLLETQGLDEKL